MGDFRGTDAAREGVARTLIIFPGALGDLLCLVPTISALARSFSENNLELMARDELAQFAVGRLGIARGHSIDRREVASLLTDSVDDDRLASRRFFSVFDRIYCFFSFDDSRFRRALTEAAAPAIVSFHRFRPAGAGHVASAYLEEVTGDSKVTEVAMNLLPEDLDAAHRAIHGIAEPKKFVAIFPGSGSPAKNWPSGKFLALADLIGANMRAIFILGPAEDALENVLIARGHPIIKDRSVGEVAAIARIASAFVGNDSGVSHLASAAGAPGVVLFGPTDPARWRPLGRVTVIRREPIDAIEPAEVMAALDAIVRHES
jgi:heptosyltransferase-3